MAKTTSRRSFILNIKERPPENSDANVYRTHLVWQVSHIFYNRRKHASSGLSRIDRLNFPAMRVRTRTGPFERREKSQDSTEKPDHRNGICSRHQHPINTSVAPVGLQ